MDERTRLVKLWGGSFGNSYFHRNYYIHPWPLRSHFWRDLIKELEVKTVLELGAGCGFNIKCIEPYVDLVIGTDVNFLSIQHKVCQSGIFPFVAQMKRLSKKYIMFMEYYSDEEIEIEYHGERNAFFKRPYDRIYNNLYEEDELYKVGDLTKDDGFDNLKYWIYSII